MSRAMALALALALAACSTESKTSNPDVDPRCLDIPWRALTTPTGHVMPEIQCVDTLDCPPPTTCQIPPAGAERGACTLTRDVREPDAPADLYGVAQFLVSVQEGDDYNLLTFSGLPSNAAFVSCAFYNCPVDGAVLARAQSRCEFEKATVDLSRSTSISLAVLSTGPEALQVESDLPACGPNDPDDPQDDRALSIATVGYFAVCRAFSETALVAVSTVVSLSRSEIGETGRRTYVTSCADPSAAEGVACLRTRPDGGETLGVCVERSCCAPCWSDRDCNASGGRLCRALQPLGPPEGDAGVPTFIGFCPDVPCSRTGDDRTTRQVCVRPIEGVTDAGPPSRDGGMAGTLEECPYDAAVRADAADAR